MTRRERIAFWTLETVILLFSIVTCVFLYGFSLDAIMFAIVIGLLYGIVLSLCVIITYNAIKAKRVYFIIGGILTSLFVLLALISMLIMGIIPNLMNIATILFIIDAIYICIAICISHFKK